MILLRMVRNVFMYPVICAGVLAIGAGIVWVLYHYLFYVIGGIILFCAVMKLHEDAVHQLHMEGAFHRLEERSGE